MTDLGLNCLQSFVFYKTPLHPLYQRCHFMNTLGTVWTQIVPTWGKHRAPSEKARCPTWASTVPDYCSFCYPCR